MDAKILELEKILQNNPTLESLVELENAYKRTGASRPSYRINLTYSDVVINTEDNLGPDEDPEDPYAGYRVITRLFTPEFFTIPINNSVAHWGDLACLFDPRKIKKAYLVWVAYSDGDTFGSQEGLHSILGVVPHKRYVDLIGSAVEKFNDEEINSELLSQQLSLISGVDIRWFDWVGYFASYEGFHYAELNIVGDEEF